MTIESRIDSTAGISREGVIVSAAVTVNGGSLEFDRHLRRGVWVLALIAVIASGIVYAAKASDERSAFIRWRPQVLQFWKGVNIYDKMYFPNPPIMPITLYPLMTLPPLAGALTWYYLKVALTVVSIWLCFRMVRPDDRVLQSWVQGAVILFSFRPILGDLHHGNNNLIILFLIVSCLYAWRKGYDVFAGLLLALAISYKVTPALFVPYFMYKRSWRIVGSTFLGMGLFLLIIPSIVIGPGFNGECLGWWWHRMLSPYLVSGAASDQEINQSMVGVLTRLLSDSKTGTGRYDVHLDHLNLFSLPPRIVGYIIKAVSLGLIGLLALFCRTKTERRDDYRLFGEFSLVVLTMLFVSERSWKHHFVTLLLPYTFLAYRFGAAHLTTRVKLILAAAMWLSAIFMATTSSELGGLFGGHQGHKLAQGYGMFLWAAVILYIATAWRVWVERGPDGAIPLPSEASQPQPGSAYEPWRSGVVPG